MSDKTATQDRSIQRQGISQAPRKGSPTCRGIDVGYCNNFVLLRLQCALNVGLLDSAAYLSLDLVNIGTIGLQAGEPQRMSNHYDAYPYCSYQSEKLSAK